MPERVNIVRILNRLNYFREIVANLKRLIAGDDPKPMNPWFKVRHIYFLLIITYY